MPRRPEGMNDKMYRPEYDGPKNPTKPGRPGRPSNLENMPMIRPDKPGRIPPRNPMMPAPSKPNVMLSENAKKAALEMMRKRSGK